MSLDRVWSKDMDDEYSFDASKKDETSEPVEASSATTLLDRLREVIEKEVEHDSIQIDVKERDGVSVVFSPNINQEQLTRWRRQAGDRTKDGLNFLKFAGVIVMNTTEQILIGGEGVTDDDGNYLTFASQEILDMVEMDRPSHEAVRRFWGSDAHLQATSLKILESAGWGEEAEVEENPTKD